MTIIVRDGLGYFALNLSLALTNVIVDLRDFLLSTHGILQNIFCSRLLFHIHAIGEGNFNIYADERFHSAIPSHARPDQGSFFARGSDQHCAVVECSVIREVEEHFDNEADGSLNGHEEGRI
ncbi:hypothetical protein SCHPADRAFT_943467 [Schizopora paradoxa]|uniref:Uncharacterized protein n=1 Tax=Schizopora paradoxa TaxID=27342 RepID=A0A0H2RCT4_9AGAM|nr:hypothetical protein SCHPADRAFT_943467 [Schizopora paradoxa]